MQVLIGGLPEKDGVVFWRGKRGEWVDTPVHTKVHVYFLSAITTFAM